MTCGDVDLRHTEQGSLIDDAELRGFARAALDLDAVRDEINDLLIEHVVEGPLSPLRGSRIAAPDHRRTADTMTRDDWQIVADQLIDDALQTLGIRGRDDRLG